MEVVIFNFVKPSQVQKWVATNAPASLKATPNESWRAYLAANGGTGNSINEQEAKFLSATSGGSLYDKWQTWLGANGGTGGGCRDKFNTKFH